ncbi:murein transglycosylase A [Thermodesulfobacteriota bacterium]
MHTSVVKKSLPWLLSLIFILFTLSGCGFFLKTPDVTSKTSLKKLKISQYPAFSDDHAYKDLGLSIEQSLAYLRRVPADREFSFGKELFTAAHLIASHELFLTFLHKNPSQKELNRFIASNYMVYQSVGSNRKREVLFTGYYEPTILGSLIPTEDYRVPAYATPSDLIAIDLSLFSERFSGEKIVGRYAGNTVLPYYERKEICALENFSETSETIAWLKDPVDLFFLQIQGSGRVLLPDGDQINLHYHATNGHPYRSIGKLLIDEGKIAKEEMSMQKIRSYLHANPHEMDRILNHNPSYVFFKLEEEGPLGYLQVPLTAERSLALDRRIFPPAAIVYIETSRPVIDPEGQIKTWEALKGFVLNQDTGGAIRGPGRADLFWGNGPHAELAAGHMQHTGAFYFLVQKLDGA